MKWLEKNWLLVAAGVVVFYLWRNGTFSGMAGAATTPNQAVPLGDGTYGVL